MIRRAFQRMAARINSEFFSPTHRPRALCLAREISRQAKQSTLWRKGMDSHDVIREAFKKTSPKEIASALSLYLSLVYKWAEPHAGSGSGNSNPLDRVNQLREVTGDTRFIQWLCERAGGYFVQNPARFREKGQEIVSATHEIVQQFAELLSAISHSAIDNAINERESEQIRAVWEELKGFTESFVLCCESGDFAKIRGMSQPMKSRE